MIWPFLVKRNFSNMPRIYKETVAQEIDDLPSYVKQGVIEFLPEIGHCLCLGKPKLFVSKISKEKIKEKRYGSGDGVLI